MVRVLAVYSNVASSNICYSSPVSYEPNAPLPIYQAPGSFSVVTDPNGFLPETTFKSSAGIIDRSPFNDSPTVSPVLSGSEAGLAYVKVRQFFKVFFKHVSQTQCAQMTRFFPHYLSSYLNENLPNNIKN